MDKKIYIIFLIVVCFAVYANSFKGVFLSDDIGAIVENPAVTNKNPIFAHFNNIIFHCTATVLVLFFLKMFFNFPASFLGALLFAVHPIHTEAVTWICGRRYSILAIIALASFLLYQSAVKEKFDIKKYILSFLVSFWYIFLFPNGQHYFYIGLPVLMAITDIYFKRTKQNWPLWIPFFLLFFWKIVLSKQIILAHIQTVSVLNPQKAFFDEDIFPVWPQFLRGVFLADWFARIIYAIYQNLYLIFWPVKLTYYHSPLYIYWKHIWEWLFCTFLAGLVLLPCMFGHIRKALYAIGVYLCFLLPLFSPVLVCGLTVERYLYFPSIFFSMLAAFVYMRMKNYRKLFYILYLSYFVFFSVRTWQRNNDYIDQKTFWERTLEDSPQSSYAYNNLGCVYFYEKDYDEAIRLYLKALLLQPNSKITPVNIERSLLKKGKRLKKISYNHYTGKWTIICDDDKEPLLIKLSNECLESGKTVGECYQLQKSTQAN